MYIVNLFGQAVHVLGNDTISADNAMNMKRFVDGNKVNTQSIYYVKLKTTLRSVVDKNKIIIFSI
jgi:hypothetical protein